MLVVGKDRRSRGVVAFFVAREFELKVSSLVPRDMENSPVETMPDREAESLMIRQPNGPVPSTGRLASWAVRPGF